MSNSALTPYWIEEFPIVVNLIGECNISTGNSAQNPCFEWIVGNPAVSLFSFAG